MTTKQKETFKVTKTSEAEGQPDKVLDLAIIPPSPAHGRKAQAEYNKTFAAALSAGGLLRARVEAYMREQKLWDDDKDKKTEEFRTQLNALELKLAKGGMKASEGRTLALEMRRVRWDFRQHLSVRTQLDVNTVEGQAENARFNSLVSQCLVYNDSGEPYYQDLDDYLAHADQEEAFQGAQMLGKMMWEIDKDFDNNLPENKFLKSYGFVNESLSLVNKTGHLIDTDGRLINDKGEWVNEKDELVDKNGVRVDKDGGYLVEAAPFLDDDGKPIVKAPVAPVKKGSKKASE